MRKAIAEGFLFLLVYAFAGVTLGSLSVNVGASLSALAFAAASSCLVCMAARRLSRRGEAAAHLNDESLSPGEPAVFLAAILLATMTSHAHGGEYFFSGWSLRGAGARAFWLHARMARFALLLPVAALPFLLPGKRRWIVPFLAVLFVVAEVLAALSLLRLAGCGPIYSDDHPSFMFRIMEFWGSFPWRENYVPHWNAGVVNSVLTSSGVPGYALLTAPLHLVFRQPHLYHAAGLAFIHAFLVPWLVVWAFRENRLDWRTALPGGMLALFANRLFFVWTFHFGTVGAGVSWAATPAALLFAYAIAEGRDPGWRACAGLALSACLLCSWPQMWVFAAIMALSVLTSARRLAGDGGRRRLVLLSCAALTVAAWVAPSALALSRAKDLMGYTTGTSGRMPFAPLVSASWRLFSGSFAKNLVMQANPLVVVFGIAGWCCLSRRPLRRWLAVVAVFASLALSVGHSLYPNMQLYRMAIPLALALAVPAAIRVGDVLRDGRPCAAPLQGAVVLLLLFGAANNAVIYGGGGFAPVEAMAPAIRELSEWIGQNVPEGARVAFAGPTVHAYGHGHVAYLPIMAGREMMSCDYYGFPPGTYEPDFPPRAARGGPGGIGGFFARHVVSHVVTCRQNYISFMESHPEEFEPAARFAYHHRTGNVDIRVFAVKGERQGLLRGADGRVAATFNRIDVEFSGTPPESAVLAYRWNDRMRATPPAEIAPAPSVIPDEGPFIEVRPNGAGKVRIDYHPRL